MNHNLWKMSITYSSDVSQILISSVSGFHKDWALEVTPEKLVSMWQGSEYVLLAVKEDRVIGYLAVIGDGQLFAFITSIEVLEEFRDQGIGTELLRRTFEHYQDRYALDLLCDESVVPFYEKLGMTRVVGMCRRNYKAS